MPSMESNDQRLRILVVEDEFVTLDMLTDALREMGYLVGGDAMDVAEAKEVLARTPIDLAILDINLRGKHGGIELGQFIKDNYGIPFIYLTAYSDPKTIEAATKTSPYGYLIKPFSPADIHAAIKVAVARVEETAGELIYLRDQSNFVRLRPGEITYVEACRNYVEVHTVSRKYVIRSTMKEMTDRLAGMTFFRPHRSYIVNADHVRGFKNDRLLVGDKRLPVSNSKLKTVQRLFSER